MVQNIKASVGKNGKNIPAEVKIVKELLNALASDVGFRKQSYARKLVTM